MLPLNHKRATSSLAPPLFCEAKNWQFKDRRFPISTTIYKLLFNILIFLKNGLLFQRLLDYIILHVNVCPVKFILTSF